MKVVDRQERGATWKATSIGKPRPIRTTAKMASTGDIAHGDAVMRWLSGGASHNTGAAEPTLAQAGYRDVVAASMATASPRLPIGHPDSAQERQAEAVADAMVGGGANQAIEPGLGLPLGVIAEAGHVALQPEASPAVAEDAPASVHEVLRSPGQPLDADTRSYFEPRFGRNLGQVRVHSDAAAAQSAHDVNARAYTVGRDIVLAVSRNDIRSEQGQRLLAHELTHVVQQTDPAGRQPAIVQRDPKGADAKHAEDPIAAAIQRLKAKYDLGDITGEHGEGWTIAQLKKVDAAFAKASPDEQRRLKGTNLLRTDKLSVMRKGTERAVAAMTTGAGGVIAFTRRAFVDDLVILHEIGHALHDSAVRELKTELLSSQAGIDLAAASSSIETARRDVSRPRAVPSGIAPDLAALGEAINDVTAAAGRLLRSDAAMRQYERDAVLAAQINADSARTALETVRSNPAVAALFELHDRQKRWVVAIDAYLDEQDRTVTPVENLTEFVAIVNKNKLARRGFAPFTEYVASFWPDKPGELFAQCYATWRAQPSYLKQHARPLFDWFQSGQHLPLQVPVLKELLRMLDTTFQPRRWKDLIP